MPKRNRKQMIAERGLWLDSYKANKPCMDCGKSFHPKCMEFHHREPHTKKGEVRRILRDGYSMQTIMNEIGKCDLLCAICHRMRHIDEPDLELSQEDEIRGVLPL
jgi:hypothetical protein